MAVYTKVSEAEAAAFLSAYDIGTFRELVGIKSGVSNSNYFLYTSEGRYVLTLYESRVQEGDVPFFLALMAHLAGKGIPCPQPVRNRTGDALGHLAGKPAAITGFLPGASLLRVTPEECGQIGRALAQLHLAVEDFPLRRPNDMALGKWEGLLSDCMAKADGIQAGLGSLLQEEINYLRQNWPKDLPRGIIHADLFPNNVFFEHGKLSGVIDFYFACEDFFAYDLAICFNAWCFEANTGFNITKAQALAKGYNDVRALSPEEIKNLAVLTRGAAMRFLATRLYDWLHPVEGALVKSLDPLEYVARLQFHQMVDDVAAYGIGL